MIQLTERLETAFNLTEDLASSLSGEELTMRLRDIPSNTIDEQVRLYAVGFILLEIGEAIH